MKLLPLLTYGAAFITCVACTTNKVDPKNIAPTPERITRYDLSLLTTYDIVQEIDSATGLEVDAFGDSVKFELKELYNGNILAITYQFTDGIVSQSIEGEYAYGTDGWISSVKKLGATSPILEAVKDESRKVTYFHDYATGLVACYPSPENGSTSYYSNQIKADTTINNELEKKLVEIYSDSSTFVYSGDALSQFETYYLRTDSFSIDIEDANGISQDGSSNEMAVFWKDYLTPQKKNNAELPHLKDDDVLLRQTTYYTPGSFVYQNPVYQLLAPLNFDIMEVPFIHSKEFPSRVTTNSSTGTFIKEYEYQVDKQNRVTEIQIKDLNNQNKRILRKIIRFTYKT